MFIFGFFLKGEDLRFFNWKLKKKLCQFLVSPLKTIFGCKNVKYNYIDYFNGSILLIIVTENDQ